MDVNIDDTIMNVDFPDYSNELGINMGINKIVKFEKNHANLENLDYEKSGHTGFASQKTTGELTNLMTENKSDLVSAINEVKETATPGLSAYEIYVKNGGTLTEEEWLESLKGADGKLNLKITNVLPASSIKWDGNIAGKETVLVGFSTFYKISDWIPSEEQLAGGTYKKSTNASVTEYPIITHTATIDGSAYEIRQTESFTPDMLVIKQPNEDYPSSTGIYAMYDSWGNQYISELSIPLFEEIDEEAIYMIPSNGSEENSYDEYIYINGNWEKIGAAKVGVNLDNYVKFTDYATNSSGGVVKISSSYGIWKFTSGTLYVSAATEAQIKARTHNYCPIVPKNMNLMFDNMMPVMTQAEYDALATKNADTYYCIVEE